MFFPVSRMDPWINYLSDSEQFKNSGNDLLEYILAYFTLKSIFLHISSLRAYFAIKAYF